MINIHTTRFKIKKKSQVLPIKLVCVLFISKKNSDSYISLEKRTRKKLVKSKGLARDTFVWEKKKDQQLVGRFPGFAHSSF